MMAQPPKVVIKKVRQYPFSVQFKTESAAFSGQIVKLTPQGFLAEVPVSTLQPLERLECSFELPVLRRTISEPVLVVKIYNQWAGGGTPQSAPPAATASQTAPASEPKSVVHLVEMHFSSVSLETKDHIADFLKASAEKK